MLSQAYTGKMALRHFKSDEECPQMASSCRNWVLHLRHLNACWSTRKVGSPCTHKSRIMRNFFNTFAFTLTFASALGITAYATTAPAYATEAKNTADMVATADEKLKTEIEGYWKKFPGRAGIAIYTPFPTKSSESGKPSVFRNKASPKCGSR